MTYIIYIVGLLLALFPPIWFRKKIKNFNKAEIISIIYMIIVITCTAGVVAWIN